MVTSTEHAATEAGHATEKAGAFAPARSRRWIVAAILVVSLLLRLPNLGAPPLERHDFRQTQTAITVQAYLDHGLTLLHYETPVFGPPWQVPFEFPTFQASAYAVARTGMPLDLACRVTALLWFYLSAILLLAVARRFAGEAAATATLAVYVLNPFSITWSRACHIDYASVALALGYLLAVASWAARPRFTVAVAAIGMGALAFLTKITTPVAVLPAIGVLALGALRRGWSSDGGTRVSLLASSAAMVAVPFAVGVAWTRWTDVIKNATPATQWLISANLRDWTLGTLTQRLVLENWLQIIRRLNWIVPGLFWIAVAFAFVLLWRRRGPARLVVVAALGAVILPIATFFNLYWVHDYYLIAVTPGLALAAGAGMVEIASLPLPRRGLVLGLATLVALVTAKKPFEYARTAYENTRRHSVVAIAHLVTEITPPERWVVVEGDDWNPRIPYLSHRRGFMIHPPFVDGRLVADRPEVATIVCFTCRADILALWPRREFVARESGATVFRASGGAETDPPRR